MPHFSNKFTGSENTMLDTYFEEYCIFPEKLPFYLQPYLEREPFICSRVSNWHNEPEIELCLEGEGTVLMNGERISFLPGEFAVAGPGVIHHTGTDSRVVYACLIISTDFCRSMGIDSEMIRFSSHFRDETMREHMLALISIYQDEKQPYRTAKLHSMLLHILLRLVTHHAEPFAGTPVQMRNVETVKSAIRYIWAHSAEKLTLDMLSRVVCMDKYAFCREFRRFTGQTVVEYINRHRCRRAAECLAAGMAVAEAAHICGFESPSFFAQTFKKYMGVLPSKYRA